MKNCLRPFVFLLFSITSLAQGNQTFQYHREYTCGNERIMVAYCRRDSDRPGERTPDAANYCQVNYPGQKTASGWPLEKAELRSDVEAKLRACGALASTTTAGGGGGNGGMAMASPGDAAVIRGRTLIQAKDYNGAMVALKEAIRLDPRHALAFHFVGIAQYNLKEYVVANAAFERALQLNVANPHHAYSWIGDCRKALGEHVKALSAYREAIRVKPDFALAFNSIGLVYHLQKDFPNAVLFYEQAARLDPKTGIYRKNVGIAHLAAGKKDEAMKAYNALVPVDAKLAGELLDEITKPTSTAAATKPRTPAESRLDDGKISYHAKDYVKALASFQEALRLDPTYAEASQWMGMSRYKQKQYPEAIAAFENAIKLKYVEPAYSHAWIGDTYYALKQYDKAIPAYTEARRLKPDHAPAIQSLGSAHYLLKQHAEALAAYLEAIKLKPDNALYRASAGDAYSALNQYDKAALSYGEAARLDPKYDYALNMLGVSHYLLKQYAAALTACEQAVKLKPDNALYLANLGDTLFQLGRKTEALAVHKKLVTLDKAKADELLSRINTSPAETQANAVADAALRKGHELFEANEYGKAIVEYQKAVAAKPNNVWLAVAHSLIGLSYTRLRDYAQATTNLLTAARLDPTDAAVLGNLGWVYERTLQFPKALAAYQEAVRLSENDKKLSQRQYNLGKIYALLGRRAEAMQVYTNLQKTDPAQAKSLLSDIEEGDKTGPAGILASDAFGWELSGESDDAQELYQNALKLKPTNPEVLFKIGTGFGSYGGKWAESLAVFRLVIALKPGTEDLAQAHYHIGETLNYMKEYAKAIPEIREAQRLKADSYYSQELGDSYRGLKRFPEALAAYQDAERLKPDSTTKIRISETYVAMGQQDTAVAYLSEVTRDPAKTAPILHEELGKLYFSMKRYPDAVSAYKQAIASYPGYKSANYGLGVVYDAMGQKQDAIAVYRVLRPLDSELAQKLLAEINKP